MGDIHQPCVSQIFINDGLCLVLLGVLRTCLPCVLDNIYGDAWETLHISPPTSLPHISLGTPRGSQMRVLPVLLGSPNSVSQLYFNMLPCPDILGEPRERSQTRPPLSSVTSVPAGGSPGSSASHWSSEQALLALGGDDVLLSWKPLGCHTCRIIWSQVGQNLSFYSVGKGVAKQGWPWLNVLHSVSWQVFLFLLTVLLFLMGFWSEPLWAGPGDACEWQNYPSDDDRGSAAGLSSPQMAACSPQSIPFPIHRPYYKWVYCSNSSLRMR